jgi:hypothetical protein
MSITKLNNLSISAVTALPSGVGGKVLQVVSANDDTPRSTTSTSFVHASNTLSVSITPSSASNKILIIVSSTFYLDAGKQGWFTIFRGATDLGAASDKGFAYANIGGNGNNAGFGMNYLDSPSSTSALTYQMYFRTDASSTIYIQGNSSRGTITCLEIAG